MRLDHLLADTLSRLLGRLVKRAIAVALLALFALAVLYHLTVAGTLELALTYGPVTARLIVAGIYALAALASVIFLYATRVKKPAALGDDAGFLNQPRNMRIAMLIESVMLGYSLAKNRSKTL